MIQIRTEPSTKRAQPQRQRPITPNPKPAGGYSFLTVAQLCLVWCAYQQGLIQYRDLRVWFALHEMVARRKLVPSRQPVYTPAELRGLVGGGGESQLRASLGRLGRAKLISWSDHDLQIATQPAATAVDLAAFDAMLHQITNHKRRVPVPRRTIRLLSQTGRPVVLATMVGYLLRCVYFRPGGVTGQGTCKASWVAATFGVGERNVKAARKHLADLGWLTLEDSPQWHKNRYGGKATVNLDWQRPDSYTAAQSESAPPSGFSTTESAPPCLHQHPLQERSKNQKPANRGPQTGVLKKEPELEKPNLRDVQLADLRDTARLLVLFEQAVQAGLSTGGAAGRLLFVTLAEHALVQGTRNPPGLFLHLLKHKLAHYATQDDETAAQQRLKRHLYGHDAQRESEQQTLVRVEVALSADAQFVAAVERVCRTRRIAADPFGLVHREKPDWTRARWDAAVAELANAQVQRWQPAAPQAGACAVGAA